MEGPQLSSQGVLTGMPGWCRAACSRETAGGDELAITASKSGHFDVATPNSNVVTPNSTSQPEIGVAPSSFGAACSDLSPQSGAWRRALPARPRSRNLELKRRTGQRWDPHLGPPRSARSDIQPAEPGTANGMIEARHPCHGGNSKAGISTPRNADVTMSEQHPTSAGYVRAFRLSTVGCSVLLLPGSAAEATITRMNLSTMDTE